MLSSPGRLFARATVVPAIAVSAWLLVAFPLLLVGQFTPAAGLVAGGPAVVAALAAVPRWVPDLPDTGGWWPVAVTGLITLGFAVVQVAYHSESLVIRRDPASYAQFATWIAQHGSLPIPQDRSLIAGDDPALSYDSLAYYQVGGVIWPQFLAGTPLVLSVGHWVGGVPGMLITAPIIGALGVLAFAGLAARLIGPRWAPLATLLLAVCLPQQWVSRTTYSEPLTQLLMLGALALAFDALVRRTGLGEPDRAHWRAAHALAGAAGVVFGLALVVRIDALRDLLPLIVFLGMLLVARRGQAAPMAVGFAVGLGYGLVAGFWLSKPYLDYLSDSVQPLLMISGGVVAVTAAAVWVLRRRGVPRTDRPAWLPTAVAVTAVLVMVGLAARPLLYTAHGHGDPKTGLFIGEVQEFEGLPVDPSRTYAEQSLYWVGWYVGLATVALATVGVAILLRRMLRGREPQWVLPLMVLAWSVATTLARPAITPDHPWTSRRLVVLVIPAFILLAVWVLAWVVRRFPIDARPAPRVLVVSAAVVAALAMLIPTAVVAKNGTNYRSDVGSVQATRDLCAAVPADASVVLVDAELATNYMQLIRGMCGVPTAAVAPGDSQGVRRVAQRIRDRGRTPVLAATVPQAISPYVPGDAHIDHPFELRTKQDASTLEKPPAQPWDFEGDVWLAVPESPPE